MNLRHIFYQNISKKELQNLDLNCKLHDVINLGKKWDKKYTVGFYKEIDKSDFSEL